MKKVCLLFIVLSQFVCSLGCLEESSAFSSEPVYRPSEELVALLEQRLQDQGEAAKDLLTALLPFSVLSTVVASYVGYRWYEAEQENQRLTHLKSEVKSLKENQLELDKRRITVENDNLQLANNDLETDKLSLEMKQIELEYKIVTLEYEIKGLNALNKILQTGMQMERLAPKNDQVAKEQYALLIQERNKLIQERNQLQTELNQAKAQHNHQGEHQQEDVPNHENEEDGCPICLVNDVPDAQAHYWTCKNGHHTKMHSACLDEHVKHIAHGGDVCPLCRGPLEKAN